MSSHVLVEVKSKNKDVRNIVISLDEFPVELKYNKRPWKNSKCLHEKKQQMNKATITTYTYTCICIYNNKILERQPAQNWEGLIQELFNEGDELFIGSWKQEGLPWSA